MLEKIEKPKIETPELRPNGTYGKFVLEPTASDVYCSPHCRV